MIVDSNGRLMQLERTVAGLELPQDERQQLYYTNAVRWLPGIEAQF